MSGGTNKEVEKFHEKKVVATEFFTDLSNVMTPELRCFIKKYTGDYQNAESLTLMFRTYDTIFEEYKKQNNKELTKEEMALILTEIMNNGKYRKLLVAEWSSFMKGNNASLLNKDLLKLKET